MNQIREWYEGLERRARIGVVAAAVVLALTVIYVVKPFSLSLGDREVPCGPAVLTFGERRGFSRTLCADAARSRLFTGAVITVLAVGGAAAAVQWFEEK